MFDMVQHAFFLILFLSLLTDSEDKKELDGNRSNIATHGRKCCLDRNVDAGLGDKVAIYWEGN